MLLLVLLEVVTRGRERLEHMVNCSHCTYVLKKICSTTYVDKYINSTVTSSSDQHLLVAPLSLNTNDSYQCIICVYYWHKGRSFNREYSDLDAKTDAQ